MPSFSKTSEKRLNLCHQDIVVICHYAIQQIDFSVVSGRRTPEEQLALYKKGRKKVNGVWVIVDDGAVVTYKDGYMSKSMHQTGKAIDLIPYPGKWAATDAEWHELAGVIKATAFMLKKYGAIEHGIEWGWDLWKWDKPHWQLSS